MPLRQARGRARSLLRTHGARGAGRAHEDHEEGDDETYHDWRKH